MLEPDNPLLERFLATADEVAEVRPEVDREMAREIFHEVATVLHNGLVLDHLDDHDTDIVVDGLRADLVSPDPGAAVRAHAHAVIESPGELHDPHEASAAYLMAASVMQL